MQQFSGQYHRCNPGVFSCEDTAYILAFSVIMLNTDAHNPSIKKERKMTLEQFLSNNRGIDQGKDLPVKMMTELYNQIKSNEIKLDPEGSHHGEARTFLALDKEGWLKKKGKKGTQKRWFVLMNNCLYYFVVAEDMQKELPRCIFPLEHVQIIEVADKQNCTFAITPTNSPILKSCKRLSDGSLVAGTLKELVLVATSPQERAEWISDLRKRVAVNPLGEIIQRKKEAMRFAAKEI